MVARPKVNFRAIIHLEVDRMLCNYFGHHTVDRFQFAF